MGRKQRGKTRLPNADTVRNRTYRANHAAIHDAYIKLITKQKRKPTLEEVSQVCGLSVNTVNKHLQELEFVPAAHELRVLTDDIILAVYSGAMGGSAGMARLWFELMESWSPKLRLANADGENIASSVMLIPHNHRDNLPGMGLISDVEWEDIENHISAGGE